MSNLPHVIAKVMCEPWACTRAQHTAIMDALSAHMENRGHAITKKEATDMSDDDEELNTGGAMFIPLHGTIGKKLSGLEMMSGGCSLDLFTERMTEAAEDDNTSAIIIDIHSPGGTVTGVHEAAALVAEINDTMKPVYAVTETMCCSAAYWIASQTSKIFATKSSEVGSIGVFAACVDRTAQMAKDGVAVNEFASGKYKALGAPWKSMTDEEKAMVQDSVMRSFKMFSDDIKARRDVDDQHMQGQVFDGEQALLANLIDELITGREDVLDLI